jgi:inosine triphosphate pyrophosphatase
MLALGPQNLHKMLDGFSDKSSQAVCTFAYSEGPGAEPVVFQGRTDGKLVPTRGPTVFGESNLLQFVWRWFGGASC